MAWRRRRADGILLDVLLLESEVVVGLICVVMGARGRGRRWDVQGVLQQLTLEKAMPGASSWHGRKQIKKSYLHLKSYFDLVKILI